MSKMRFGVVIYLASAALVLAGRGAGATAQGDKYQLPVAVAKAIAEYKPGAEIEKLDVETQDGIRFYDLEFKGDRGEMDVAEDGTILDIVTIVQMKDLPTLAAEAIQKAAVGARILRLEKSEILSEIKAVEGKGKIVKLDKPQYVFEAELIKDNRTGEVTVAEDGTIIDLKWD